MRRFAPDDAAAWNAFVDASRNGTFLLRRDYMDYHAARFADASLTVWVGGRLAALFPANRSGDEIVSHSGLTYGGLVLDDAATTETVTTMWLAIVELLRHAGVRRLVYKTIPSIYHRVSAEMDREALERSGARLVRCDMLSVVSPLEAWSVSAGKARSVKRAQRVPGVEVGPSGEWAAFWDILHERLRERYGAAPVHSLAEIELLAARFPKSIMLVTGRVAGVVGAGAVLYESARVVRTQYLAANALARELSLLDLVVWTAIRNARALGKWVDLGPSVGRDGALNAGLAGYKARFGARAVAHDVYALDLA